MTGSTITGFPISIPAPARTLRVFVFATGSFVLLMVFLVFGARFAAGAATVSVFAFLLFAAAALLFAPAFLVSVAGFLTGSPDFFVPETRFVFCAADFDFFSSFMGNASVSGWGSRHRRRSLGVG